MFKLKHLASLLVILLLLSVLVESSHHHDDGDNHADCSICVAYQLQSDSSYSSPVFEVHREITGTLYSRSIPTFVSKLTFTPANSRAPPA